MSASPTPASPSCAILNYANLTDAKVTQEQLATCKSLNYATMPNGQKYEDWLETPDGKNWLKRYNV